MTVNKNWRKSLGTEDNGGALFTDLSKTFGSIDNQLLITKLNKLNVYAFDTDALKFVNFCLLKARKQKNKMNSS